MAVRLLLRSLRQDTSPVRSGDSFTGLFISEPSETTSTLDDRPALDAVSPSAPSRPSDVFLSDDAESSPPSVPSCFNLSNDDMGWRIVGGDEANVSFTRRFGNDVQVGSPSAEPLRCVHVPLAFDPKRSSCEGRDVRLPCVLAVLAVLAVPCA